MGEGALWAPLPFPRGRRSAEGGQGRQADQVFPCLDRTGLQKLQAPAPGEGAEHKGGWPGSSGPAPSPWGRRPGACPPGGQGPPPGRRAQSRGPPKRLVSSPRWMRNLTPWAVENPRGVLGGEGKLHLGVRGRPEDAPLRLDEHPGAQDPLGKSGGRGTGRWVPPAPRWGSRTPGLLGVWKGPRESLLSGLLGPRPDKCFIKASTRSSYRRRQGKVKGFSGKKPPGKAAKIYLRGVSRRDCQGPLSPVQ